MEQQPPEFKAQIDRAELQKKYDVALAGLAELTARIEAELSYAETLERMRQNLQHTVEELRTQLRIA